ncbi:MAG: T9SS type A sorting domain-containing protein [Bacteroidales bacterium]|nr:T9SS type A sorting domain-containing protein [Bacteroidales bacterium]
MKKHLFFFVVVLCFAAMTVQAQQRKVLVEEFTASTCGPCASVNSWFNPLLVTNADKVVVVKYQMNWPGNGDPYYTAEGGTRRSYYGVSGVPTIFINGTTVNANQSVVQSAIDAAYTQPAEATITGNFRVDGDMIYVKTTVTPLVSGSNFMIHCIVDEKETTKNKGGNGEQAFHHVMMKMFPDGGGTLTTITANEPMTLNFSHDMSTTYVEEMDDLEVAVFVQDKPTKAVLNAENLTENNTMSLPPTDITATQEEETLDINLSWTATRGVDGYNIYRNGAKVNTTPVTETTYKDTAPEYGVTYTYAVASIVDGVEGFGGTTSGFADIPVPKNVQATQVSELKVSITWDAIPASNVDGYNIYRDGIKCNSKLLQETEYLDSVKKEGHYCYQIIAVVKNINSKLSEPGCVDVALVGISETEKDALFTLYPNPVAGTLNIDTKETITDCQVFNLQGQLIYATKSGVKEIATDGWAAGTYIIRITTDKGSAEQRVIKN